MEDRCIKGVDSLFSEITSVDSIIWTSIDQRIRVFFPFEILIPSY